jgi:CRP-like cAMP-binding protein
MNGDLLAQLRQVPLFSGLDDETLQPLAACCRRRRFGAKEALFHEDDPGQTLYVVVSGCVSIEKVTESGKTVHIARRGPGEHFGELSLVDDMPRSASVVTDEPCELLMLHQSEFAQCLEKHPAIALNIIRALALRLRQAMDQSVKNETLDVMGRLAAFLLEAAAAQGVNDPAGGKRLPRLTEQEIADRIGTTRESVNRKLSRLKEIGAVRRSGRSLIVMNRRKLRDLLAAP